MVDLASDTDEFREPGAAETAMASTAQIYITSAYSDRYMAERIANALASRGYEVVWERDLGAPQSVARSAAQQAPCVLALVSRASQTSKWVLDDAELALARDALIVVRLEQQAYAMLPGAPSEPVTLNGWNGDDEHDGWRTLLGRIELMAGAPSRKAGSGATTVIAQAVGIVMFAVICSVFGMPQPVVRETAEADLMPNSTERGGPEAPTIEPASAPKPGPVSMSAKVTFTPTEAPAMVAALPIANADAGSAKPASPDDADSPKDAPPGPSLADASPKAKAEPSPQSASISPAKLEAAVPAQTIAASSRRETPAPSATAANAPPPRAPAIVDP